MSQLWRKISDLTLPHYVQNIGAGQNSSRRSISRKIKTAAFVRWPNGKPCSAINMYLLDSEPLWTGDTATQESSKLTHLIRYCFDRKCRLSELNDSDLYDIANELINEKKPTDLNVRVRNNNTVRAILQAALKFLIWFQDNLYVGDIPLVGDKDITSKITCTKRINHHKRNSSYWHHPSFPSAVSTDPKLPISYKMIEAIEEQVEVLYEEDSYNGRAKRRFGITMDGEDFKAEDLFIAFREYISARRDFMLWMMRHTGCRPSEMAGLSVEKSYQSTASKKPFILIPTLKRRKEVAPDRRFVLSSASAIDVRTYLTARTDWVEACKSFNSAYSDPGSMFLGTGPGRLGSSISNGALEKDFEKLCNLAGFKNQQSCFSMFRHLFCTEQVQIHLSLWQQNNGPIQEKDYRTLLEKVREKTGHGNWESLLTYIDYAHEMNGAWEPVTRALNQLEASNRLRKELRLLRKELRSGNTNQLSPDDVLKMVDKRLSEIMDTARHDGLGENIE